MELTEKGALVDRMEAEQSAWAYGTFESVLSRDKQSKKDEVETQQDFTTNCGDFLTKRSDDSLHKREVSLCYSMLSNRQLCFIHLAGNGTYGTRVRSCSAISLKFAVELTCI